MDYRTPAERERHRLRADRAYAGLVVVFAAGFAFGCALIRWAAR